MNLTIFYQLAISVFCVVATIFMVTIFVWTIVINAQFKQLIKKLDEILEIAKVTVIDTKNFTERTIQSLETFKKSIFTFDFIGRIVAEIIKMIKNNYNNSEGVKHGQAN